MNENEPKVDEPASPQPDGTTPSEVPTATVPVGIESEWYFTAAEGVEGAAAAGTSYADQPPLKASSPLHDLTICVLVMEGGAVFTGVSRGEPGPAERQQAKLAALAKVPK